MTLTPEERTYAPGRLNGPTLGQMIEISHISGTRSSSWGDPSKRMRALEKLATRLGMCFRVYRDDVPVLRAVFPEEVPAFLLRDGIEACFTELQKYGLLSPAKGEGNSPAYVVPNEVLKRLDYSRSERSSLPRDEYLLQKRKDHVVLAEGFLAAKASVVRRRRYQAEALVQFRKAQEWERLEGMFESLSIHLFGTHDPYVGRACINIPERALRRHPSLAIAATMAHASAVINADHRGLDDSFEQMCPASFEETESRIDALIAFYGPKWMKRPTIDGKLFLGIHWMRHHRQRGDITAVREIMDCLTALVLEHVALRDFPTESNLHWLENERGVLEFMDANWPVSYRHQKKVIDVTFGSAVPGEYLPRFACTVSALQQALSSNRNEAIRLVNMATSLFDKNGNQGYVEFTLQIAQLILCLDELDFRRGENLASQLDERLFGLEIWGVAVRFVQLFDLLLDRHAAKQARLDRVHMAGPGTHQISPLSASFVWQAQSDVFQAQGQMQRSRESYKSRPKVLFGENLADARLHYMAGRYDRALRLSRSIFNKEDVIPRDRGIASALIVAAHMRLVDTEQAKRALVECLEVSINAATLLPIALLPKEVRESVIRLARTDPRWSRLAETVGLSTKEMEHRFAQVGQCFPDEAPLVDLTPRENVILKLLEEEYPQTEIARQEHVTLSTVKKQIGSIYRKLGATSRKEALEIASHLDLL